MGPIILDPFPNTWTEQSNTQSLHSLGGPDVIHSNICCLTNPSAQQSPQNQAINHQALRASSQSTSRPTRHQIRHFTVPSASQLCGRLAIQYHNPLRTVRPLTDMINASNGAIMTACNIAWSCMNPFLSLSPPLSLFPFSVTTIGNNLFPWNRSLLCFCY